MLSGLLFFILLFCPFFFSSSLDEIGSRYFVIVLDGTYNECALKGVTRSEWARKLFKQAIKMSITSFVNQSEVAAAAAAALSFLYDLQLTLFHVSFCICRNETKLTKKRNEKYSNYKPQLLTANAPPNTGENREWENSQQQKRRTVGRNKMKLIWMLIYRFLLLFTL